MGALGLLLALSASAAWGSADFLAGRTGRGLPVLKVALWSKLAGLAFMGAACLATASLPTGDQTPWAAAAGLAGSAALLCLYRALALGPMSIVAPISACCAAVPVLVAAARGDLPGAVTSAGLAVAFAGAVAAARPAGTDDAAERSRSTVADAKPVGGGPPTAADADHPPRPAVLRREALALSVAAAVLIGLALTFLQIAAEARGGSSLGVSLVQTATTVTVLLVLATARGVLAPPHGPVGRPVAAIGVLDVGANVLFTAASARANPAAVAVLGSLYPVITVLLARALLHERLAPPQAAGVAVALLGVVLIGAGG